MKFELHGFRFLLTIHPTALEAGDFLSTDVKILLPLYRLRPSFSMPKIFRINLVRLRHKNISVLLICSSKTEIFNFLYIPKAPFAKILLSLSEMYSQTTP